MENIVKFLLDDIENRSIGMNIVNLYNFIHFKTLNYENSLKYLPSYNYFRYGYVLSWENKNFRVYYHINGSIELITYFGEFISSINNYDDNNSLILAVLEILLN